MISIVNYVIENSFKSLIIRLNTVHNCNNKEKYLSYFYWKQDYVWGLTQLLTPFCDLCLRLHLDSTPNVIDDINAWWIDNACYRPRSPGLFGV